MVENIGAADAAALEEYFMFASGLHSAFHLLSSRVPTDELDDLPERDDDLVSMFIALHSAWCAALWALVEGWLESGARDPRVAQLLANQRCVDALRRYRNLRFHYSNEAADWRHDAYVKNRDIGQWQDQLHAALGRALFPDVDEGSRERSWQERYFG